MSSFDPHSLSHDSSQLQCDRQLAKFPLLLWREHGSGVMDPANTPSLESNRRINWKVKERFYHPCCIDLVPDRDVNGLGKAEERLYIFQALDLTHKSQNHKIPKMWILEVTYCGSLSQQPFPSQHSSPDAVGFSKLGSSLPWAGRRQGPGTGLLTLPCWNTLFSTNKHCLKQKASVFRYNIWI